MFSELDSKGRIFDLPAEKFVVVDPLRDYSVRFHGHMVPTPYGPAAGPHTQLAQNIVLAWLSGGRIIELKTVQIQDEPEVPRPCIDVQAIGFNIEWSQELTLEQSLEEYVKAAMLVQMLAVSGRLPVSLDSAPVVFDMSVGYDLEGITSDQVQAFVSGMKDACRMVERLRRQIPGAFKEYRDLPFQTRVSDSVTLSTFHGCPPREIERIGEFLLERAGLHCVVKLNPTLLGKAEVHRLLHDALGYDDIRIPDGAFDRDTTWQQAEELVGQLGRLAVSLGLGFGVKFANTLVVENHRGVFPRTARTMYLSGPPLHVLAMHLVRRLRRQFGDQIPVSFSGGVDRTNFADAVALGLVPVSACTDLLKPGGYGRPRAYFRELAVRMDAAGARTISDFIIRGLGQAHRALDRLGVEAPLKGACEQALTGGADLRQAAGEKVYARWVSEATLLNTEAYVERLEANPHYGRAQNEKPPKKIGRRLQLFDCITCDRCIPVCPNDANFAFVVPPTTIPILKLRREGETWRCRQEGELKVAERHQIGNFADLCNDCGNCDAFCPEDGGPYKIKPRFFGSQERWRAARARDGFYVERHGSSWRVFGRFAGEEYEIEVSSGRVRYTGQGFSVTFEEHDPQGTISGDARAEVDLTCYVIMDALGKAVLSSTDVNWISALEDGED
jgi:putative selenate reductase